MKKSRPTDGKPLVADLSGIVRDDDGLRCPLCGAKTKTLYVTARKLNRCAHCLGRAVKEEKAVYRAA